jgi:hypothetical protein
MIILYLDNGDDIMNDFYKLSINIFNLNISVINISVVIYVDSGFEVDIHLFGPAVVDWNIGLSPLLSQQLL